MTRSRFTVKMRVDIPGAARKAMDQAAKVVFAEMFAEMQDAMGSKAWAWPRDTIRSNGQPVGSPRNIVDTGLLRASGVAFSPTARAAKVGRTGSYASFVHSGAWIFPYGNKNRQRVYIPGRPWTTAVTGETPIAGITPYDFEGRFKLHWRKFFKP